MRGLCSCRVMWSRHYSRTKYGSAISATPRSTSQAVPDTKYGNTINASPHTSGTIARCFRPHTKKPSPIAPNNTPQSNVAGSMPSSPRRPGQGNIRPNLPTHTKHQATSNQQPADCCSQPRMLSHVEPLRPRTGQSPPTQHYTSSLCLQDDWRPRQAQVLNRQRKCAACASRHRASRRHSAWHALPPH